MYLCETQKSKNYSKPALTNEFAIKTASDSGSVLFAVFLPWRIFTRVCSCMKIAYCWFYNTITLRGSLVLTYLWFKTVGRQPFPANNLQEAHCGYRSSRKWERAKSTLAFSELILFSGVVKWPKQRYKRNRFWSYTHLVDENTKRYANVTVSLLLL